MAGGLVEQELQALFPLSRVKYLVQGVGAEAFAGKKAADVVVTLSDPASLGSDTRQIGLVWAPKGPVAKGAHNVQEGGSYVYPLTEIPEGKQLLVAADKELPVEVKVVAAGWGESARPPPVPGPMDSFFGAMGGAIGVIAGVVVVGGLAYLVWRFAR